MHTSQLAQLGRQDVVTPTLSRRQPFKLMVAVNQSHPLDLGQHSAAGRCSHVPCATRVREGITIHSHPVTTPDESEISPESRLAYVRTVMRDYEQQLQTLAANSLGYPVNQELDFGDLGFLQNYCINNLGDPFIQSNLRVHSREFEIGVLDWFAQLWGIGLNDYWGYVTSCGSEGNYHGILVGRENHPDALLYTSKASHYSLGKAARMYRMDCVPVDIQENGQMDCSSLEAELRANRGRHAVININCGTTVMGAMDDVDEVVAALKRAGYSQDEYYIHVDGALSNIMNPFVPGAPIVNFSTHPIGSMSVSGHKFLGCPMPCGITITRLEHVEVLSNTVEVINSRDATISGSRAGLASVFMWNALMKKGTEGIRRDVAACLRRAEYLRGLLKQYGIWCMRNNASNQVVFTRPSSNEFCTQWQLTCMEDKAQVIVMQHVTYPALDKFAAELAQELGLPPLSGEPLGDIMPEWSTESKEPALV